MYVKFFKRLLDVIISLGMLIVFGPIILIFTILLTISTKGNPFFLQKRPGKNGKIFTIFKFKTMNDRKDIHGNLLPDTE
ncbi:MAG: sugar transferase, partial [Flavobacteriaceae bacterium]